MGCLCTDLKYGSQHWNLIKQAQEKKIIYRIGRSVWGNISLGLKNIPRTSASAVFEALGNISPYGPPIR